MERSSHARGFSLLETVVAVAIAVLVGWVLFHVLSQLLLTSRVQAVRDLEQSSIGQLTDALSAEEDDAWAIYVPPSDVLGHSNGDGHEVDFFTRDGKQRAYFWAYDYDAARKTVQRYRFSAPGASPVADVAYSGVTKFVAQTFPVTALQDASTPVYSALYGGASLRSGIVHFYPNMPWIAGGNNITYVHLEGATMRRDLELVTQTAPSGFTVVLNYTPSPSASPSSAPTVWPAAIVFAAPNMTLAAAPQRAFDAALALNALFGGGVARAAPIPVGCGIACPKPSPIVKITPTPVVTSTPAPPAATPTPLPATPTPAPATPAPPADGSCTAIAYADAAMTQRLPAGTANPYTGDVVVDANGCYTDGTGSSAQFWVHEDGYVASFFDATNYCSSGLIAGSWTPTTASGPTAAQAFTADGNAISGCRIAFADTNGKTASAYASILFPSPMYAQVDLTATSWTYDCIDMRNGKCWNGGWQSSARITHTEYVSANQGATWQSVAQCGSATACPYPPQFVDVEEDCESDSFHGGACPGTGYTKSNWTPYAPPNAP